MAIFINFASDNFEHLYLFPSAKEHLSIYCQVIHGFMIDHINR